MAWRRWLASIISMRDLEDGDQDVSTSRAAIVLGVLTFLRHAAVGGVVVLFLALSGAVSRGTTVRLGVAVVVVSAALALGVVRLTRRS
jgi:hypothetical protein